jgi:hypothetical protein
MILKMPWAPMTNSSPPTCTLSLPLASVQIRVLVGSAWNWWARPDGMVMAWKLILGATWKVWLAVRYVEEKASAVRRGEVSRQVGLEVVVWVRGKGMAGTYPRRPC